MLESVVAGDWTKSMEVTLILAPGNAKQLSSRSLNIDCYCGGFRA